MIRLSAVTFCGMVNSNIQGYAVVATKKGSLANMYNYAENRYRDHLSKIRILI